jgi:hypothetical protein
VTVMRSEGDDNRARQRTKNDEEPIQTERIGDGRWWPSRKCNMTMKIRETKMNCNLICGSVTMLVISLIFI